MTDLDSDTIPLWRIIQTDWEYPSGVAPVCPNQNDYTVHSTGAGYMRQPADVHGFYDCCPGPRLECGTNAPKIAALLNEERVTLCD